MPIRLGVSFANGSDLFVRECFADVVGLELQHIVPDPDLRRLFQTSRGEFSRIFQILLNIRQNVYNLVFPLQNLADDPNNNSSNAFARLLSFPGTTRALSWWCHFLFERRLHFETDLTQSPAVRRLVSAGFFASLFRRLCRRFLLDASRK